MTGSSPLSYPAAYAYAYTAGNAYAYAYGANAGQAGSEAYGYDAGNPVLAAALDEVRLAMIDAGYPNVLGQAKDVGGGRIWGAGPTDLPPAGGVAGWLQCGAQPRLSMAQLELMSGLKFLCPTAGLAQLQWDSGGATFNLLNIQRPDRAQFESQLEKIDGRIGDRGSRIREIVTQVAPPIAYFASVVNLQFGRHRRTLEFIDMALQFAYAVGQRFKLALNCPRPSDYTATVQPVIEVPQHASLPAGHAIESQVTATLLTHVVRGVKGSLAEDYLRRLAFRIADNRVVAGVHFPVDCLVGRLMGDALASYVLSRCGEGPAKGVQFAPAGHPGAALLPDARDVAFAGEGCSAPWTIPTSTSDILAEQLRLAKAEWE